MTDYFEDYFHDFQEAAFGFPLPQAAFMTADWAAYSAADVEAVSKGFANNGLNDVLVWETRKSAAAEQELRDDRQERAADLAQDVRNLSPDMIDETFSIVRPVYSDADFDTDIWNFKINHGYWEQHFMIHHDGYDRDLMRPTARHGFRSAYHTPRFDHALREAVRRIGETSNGNLLFPDMDFGFAFHSGVAWHEDWNTSQWQRQKNPLQVARGTFAGAKLFLDGISSDVPVVFADGAFAKQTLLTGELKDLLLDMADRSDSVIFCVPPHLEKVRLEGVDPAKQSTLPVSGRFVHHAWPPTLFGVARAVVDRLSRGETVTLLVQAAVFSGLLACYLKAVKAEMNLPGRLYFLDLGQALDVATPQAGGWWIEKIQRNMDTDTDVTFDQINPFKLVA